jgi:hypothetical protein
MARWLLSILALALVGFLGGRSPALACALCGGAAQNRQTLRQDLEQAKLVVCGSVANPRFLAQGPPGSGVTDFRVTRVLKEEPSIAAPKLIELPRYIPVPDPRQPPQFVVFCDFINGKLDPGRGRLLTSPALLDYLAGARALQGKSRTETLLFYFRYLDHPDEAIATDAYLEFARSTDKEVGEVAKHLSPAPLRKLLGDPKTPADRLGMFAFLMGGCGNDQDAACLEKLIKQPPERVANAPIGIDQGVWTCGGFLGNSVRRERDVVINAMDGILSGYISLRPKQGWDLAVSILADARKPFPERFAVARMLRFYHSWKPEESRPQIVRAMGVMLGDGEVADLAIEDLRTWQIWDLTPQVLAQFGKPSHAAPIARRAIIRYALCCPQPEAREFLETARRRDAELVRDLEESLALDRQK